MMKRPKCERCHTRQAEKRSSHCSKCRSEIAQHHHYAAAAKPTRPLAPFLLDSSLLPKRPPGRT